MAASDHRSTCAGERLVAVITEYVMQMGDRARDLWIDGAGIGVDHEAGDGRCRFVVSEPTEKDCQNHKRSCHQVKAAGVVVVANRQCQVLERFQRISVSRGDPRQADRVNRFEQFVSAFMRDGQSSAMDVVRGGRVRVTVGKPVCEQSPRAQVGIVGCLSGSEQPVGRGYRFIGQACDHQGEDQGLPGERPRLGLCGDESAATLGAPQGICHHVSSVKRGVHRVRHVVVLTAFDGGQPRLAIATKIIDPPGDSALRGHHVKRASRGCSTARAGSIISSAHAIGSCFATQ